MFAYRERRRFTPEEYLDLEGRSDVRSEYIDGEIFLMTGGSLEHNLIAGNVFSDLKAGLESGPSKVFMADVRLFIERHALFTYPDIMVVCGEPRRMPDRKDTLIDSTLILDVLSPSTEEYDRGEKFRFYRSLPSLSEYVVIAQDRVLVERHHRREAGEWLWTELQSLDAQLKLLSLGLEIPLARIYRGLQGLGV